MTTVYDTAFAHTITLLYGGAFYTGTSATSAEVPDKYPVALDGRPFMLDDASMLGHPMWRTIPTLRNQQDDREAGELSLNPEGLWRRSSSSWELGSGQVMYDDENSQRQRVRASKGVNVWTPGQATLLPATSLVASVNAAANTVPVVSTESHVYWADQNTVVRSDLTTQTSVTGTPAAPVTSMVSVGSYVLVGYASNGVYAIAAGSTSGALWATDAVTPTVVGWAKGRVIVGVGNAIYNPVTAFTGSAALPIPMLTVPDPSFRWVGVAEGTSWIFMGGHSGDKSTIYRTVVRADGTALDVPTVAGRVPDGEILTSMYGYLGVVILGTNKGFRIAEPNGNGDLILGALIDIGAAVYSMVGHESFVYFGWTNYDSTSTGIGRMDLSNLTDSDNLVPAYASDLMATAQGIVAGVAWSDPTQTLVFGVNGAGVYKQHPTDIVPTGTITTGVIRYGITEEKVVTGARPSFTGSGVVTLELARDEGTFASIPGNGAQERGTTFEMRATLTAIGGLSPTFKSMTLYCYPAPEGTMFVDLDLLISEKIETLEGVHAHMDIADTLEFLRDRWLTKVLTSLQCGSTTFQGTIEGFQFRQSNEAAVQKGQWNGTAPISFKVIS